MLTAAQRRDLLGLALLALSLFLGLSLVPAAALGAFSPHVFPPPNLMGVLGEAAARWGGWLFGAGLPLLAAIPALGGAACFGWISRERATSWTLLIVGLSVLVPTGVALMVPVAGVGGARSVAEGPAGWIGRTLSLPLIALLGWFGGVVAYIFILLALFVATVGWNPARTLAVASLGAARSVAGRVRRGREVTPAAPGPEPEGGDDDEPPLPAAFAAPSGAAPPELAGLEPFSGGGAAGLVTLELSDESSARDALSELLEELPEDEPRRRKRLLTARTRRTDAADPETMFPDPGGHGPVERPPATLLARQPARDASLFEKELDRLGRVLVETLRTFKVEGHIGGRTTGPVVTQFEVVPAPGVKVNRIASLDADLALALKAASVRIVAPIPGKGAVGVEVPNPEPEVVYLREILESPAFQQSRGQLPLALGKDLSGTPYVADLARMPHLLIAGATGSGKSICINTLVTSLIYRYSAAELRLLMIDPKMVELSMYGDLPHLRHPVVTDPRDAATVLKWAVLEMERRYALLSENGARSLGEFNRRAAGGQPLRRADPAGDETDPFRWVYTDGPLPYVVLVVDELADLMMAVQAEIERPLAQLAQKARAIGIHLIVATQRPSVNVITGLIKANFPCRIAFRVSSKVDSRTILDQNGADALLGNGDMLFMPPGQSDPVRIQGAYLSTADTERLMAWYRGQGQGRRDEEDDILAVVRAREVTESSDDSLEDPAGERDALFRQAAEVCIQFQQGSTSLLQRRLRIGYGRAARIIDQLHHAGILGPPDGSKPREVLIGLESLDAILERG